MKKLSEIKIRTNVKYEGEGDYGHLFYLEPISINVLKVKLGEFVDNLRDVLEEIHYEELSKLECYYLYEGSENYEHNVDILNEAVKDAVNYDINKMLKDLSDRDHFWVGEKPKDMQEGDEIGVDIYLKDKRTGDLTYAISE